jgi:hypothetical protein
MHRRHAAVLAAVCSSLVLAVPAAEASPLPASCPQTALEQPFLPWLDPLHYVLAPDGGLEAGGAGWDLDGGAAVSAGNEPFNVHGDGDSKSLALPTGASAVSPQMCIGLDRPLMRLFVRRTAGSLLSMLKIEVLYDGPSGNLNVTSLGVLTLGSGWQPTTPAPILASVLPVIDGTSAQVAFRFTAMSGSWRVDDVYVDPYAKH